MEKKYELTDETITIESRTLYRIKALKDFSYTKKGDLGGFVESEDNLSPNGNCWLYDNAKIYGNARICGNACICSNARIFGNACVCGNAKIYGNAEICGNACIYNNARITGNTCVNNSNIGLNGYITNNDEYTYICWSNR